ncbi:Uncharacterized protein F54H12.2 [Exaiptasia diaphana]|nr:Uncharacterized protein F54H12.2 [Exaiptasia diaphana]
MGVVSLGQLLDYEGWYPDTPGRIDELNPTPRLSVTLGSAKAAVGTGGNPTNAELNRWIKQLVCGAREEAFLQNEGATMRWRLTCGGRKVHFSLTPNIAALRTLKLLPPGCELEFVIYWNRPELVFMADQTASNPDISKAPKFRIVENSPKIKVKNIMLKEEIHVELENEMLNKAAMARYPYLAERLKSATIPNGRRMYDWNNVFSGNCPNYLVLGCIRGEAFNGNYSYFPYNFSDMCQSNIRITRDGQEIPMERIMLHDHYKEEGFKALLAFTGQGIESPPIGISRETYAKGYYLTLINFNPDGEQNFSHDYDRNKGNVNIRLEFSKDTEHNTTIIAIGYFENQGWLDGNKNFTLKHGTL